jgi:hypothetical protein
MAFARDTIDTLMDATPDGVNWKRFDSPMRDKAVLQAQRMLTLKIGEALTETASAETDLVRHDLATAYQAHHVLTTGRVLADGTMAGPKHIASEEDAEEVEPPLFSDMALMFLYGTASPPEEGGAGESELLNLPYQVTYNQG